MKKPDWGVIEGVLVTLLDFLNGEDLVGLPSSLRMRTHRRWDVRRQHNGEKEPASRAGGTRFILNVRKISEYGCGEAVKSFVGRRW